MTGSTKERPQLQKMIEQLREGDVIVVWKLDRLARSLKDLVGLVNEIQDKGAGLQSLNDAIDTTTPHGKFTFHLFAALAEFERDIIRERTNAGLAAARARGRKGGRVERLPSDSPKPWKSPYLARPLQALLAGNAYNVARFVSPFRLNVLPFLSNQLLVWRINHQLFHLQGQQFPFVLFLPVQLKRPLLLL